MKIGPAVPVRVGHMMEKIGQHYLKKVTKWLYFICRGRNPSEPTETKICTEVKLADIITCEKFQNEIYRGYNFTRVKF